MKNFFFYSKNTHSMNIGEVGKACSLLTPAMAKLICQIGGKKSERRSESAFPLALVQLVDWGPDSVHS